MEAVSREDIAPASRCVLIGVPDASDARGVGSEVARHMAPCSISSAANLTELRSMAIHLAPRAILLDESLLAGAPLSETVRQIAATAPVVLLAAEERQTEVTRLVASGEADFVARSGEYVPLVAALLERRLRWAEISEFALGPAWHECSEDIGEVFRHEINNPLTGILGNAEMLLAHRDRLPFAETQRLQTVVDLAVRLRETVRRVSNAWDRKPHPVKSA
jgi:signal transduction histidine kinase